MRSGNRTLAAAVLTGLLFTAALTAPLSALATTSAPAAPAQQPIRIGLATGLTAAEVTGSSGLLVVAGGQVLLELPADQPLRVKLVGSQLVIDGLDAPQAAPVRLLPRAPGFVLYKSKPYRGEFQLVMGSLGRISLVNVLNLEDYLLGVVPKEMPPSWPAEALKAQAVSARNYTLTNLGKRQAEGFDLRDTNDDQVYGGVEAEHAATTEAVRATKGKVLTYQGKLISTYYFSSSGGHTENNEHIWTGGSPVPYLRGVPDFDNVPNSANTKGNQYFAWSYDFTPVELAQKLKVAGHDVGEVKAVTPGAPGASGRPTSWTVQGSKRQVNLTMQQMRSALGLPAPPRTIAMAGQEVVTVTAPPPPPTVTIPPVQPNPVYALGADGSMWQRQVSGSFVVSAAGVSQRADGPAVALGGGNVTIVGLKPVAKAPPPVETPPPTPTPAPAPPTATGFTVVGGGNGHGVGLSQWGAHGLALQGKSYSEILTHFYTGTKVETR